MNEMRCSFYLSLKLFTLRKEWTELRDVAVSLHRPSCAIPLYGTGGNWERGELTAGHYALLQRLQFLYLLLHFGHSLPHTVLSVAFLKVGLPHRYTAGVHTALNRAMMAKRLVASFLNVSPLPTTSLRTMLRKEGHHNNKKVMTTKMIILNDSLVLSFSALGGSLSSWYLAITYSLIVMTTLVNTMIWRVMVPNTYSCVALERGKKIEITAWE